MVFRCLLVAASALVAGPAFGEDGTAAPPALTVTGGVTLVSQYRFRGISLSDEHVALQGTINLNHASGFYVGTWSSMLDGFGALGGSNLEVDLYGGWRHRLARDVTLDAGLLYYAYPGSRGGDFEFFEPYANVTTTLGPVTAKVGGNFAPSQAALGHNSNVYAYGELSAAIPRSPFSLTSHLGWSHGDTPLTPSGDDLDWSLGATTTWRNLTLGIAYVDTNLSGAEAALGGAPRDIVDGAVVVSLGASF